MPRLAETMATMERAEDLFHAFGVAFDPQVLATHRLHILRRFGRTLAAQGATRATGRPDRDGDWLTVAEALAEAHAYFAAGGKADIRHPAFDRSPLVQLRTPSCARRA